MCVKPFNPAGSTDFAVADLEKENVSTFCADHPIRKSSCPLGKPRKGDCLLSDCDPVLDQDHIQHPGEHQDLNKADVEDGLIKAI